MKRKDWLIIGGILLGLALATVTIMCTARAGAQKQSEKTALSEHHHFVRCPACHLVKRPPDECGDFTGWAWEECQDLVHRYPNE